MPQKAKYQHTRHIPDSGLLSAIPGMPAGPALDEIITRLLDGETEPSPPKARQAAPPTESISIQKRLGLLKPEKPKQIRVDVPWPGGGLHFEIEPEPTVAQKRRATPGTIENAMWRVDLANPHLTPKDRETIKSWLVLGGSRSGSGGIGWMAARAVNVARSKGGVEALRAQLLRWQASKATAKPSMGTPSTQEISLLEEVKKLRSGYVAPSIANPSGKLRPSRSPFESSVDDAYRQTMDKVGGRMLRPFVEEQIAGNPIMRKRLLDPNTIEGRMARWDMEHVGYLTLGDTSRLSRGMERARAAVERQIRLDLIHEREGYAPVKSAFASFMDEAAPYYGLGRANQLLQDEQGRGGIGDTAQMFLDMGSEIGHEIDSKAQKWIQDQIDAVMPDEMSWLGEGNLPEELRHRIDKARADWMKGYYGGLASTPTRAIGGIFGLPNAITTALDPDTGGPKWSTLRGFFPENPFTLGFTPETENLTPKEIGQRTGRSAADWAGTILGAMKGFEPEGPFSKASFEDAVRKAGRSAERVGAMWNAAKEAEFARSLRNEIQKAAEKLRERLAARKSDADANGGSWSNGAPSGNPFAKSSEGHLGSDLPDWATEGWKVGEIVQRPKVHPLKREAAIRDAISEVMKLRSERMIVIRSDGTSFHINGSDIHVPRRHSLGPGDVEIHNHPRGMPPSSGDIHTILAEGSGTHVIVSKNRRYTITLSSPPPRPFIMADMHLARSRSLARIAKLAEEGISASEQLRSAIFWEEVKPVLEQYGLRINDGDGGGI